MIYKLNINSINFSYQIMRNGSSFSLPILRGLETIKNSKNNIILFGSVGNGKTSLLNKICNEDYEVSDRGYSCTRNIQYAYSLKNNMILIDFPGLNSTKDIVGHLKTQKTALSSIQVRMICFVIKYSPRNDDFERELSQMLFIFNNYLKNIIIIITKSEDVFNDIKRKEEIKYLFKNQFGIENTLFTTKNIDGSKLCEDLYNMKEKMENIKQIIVKTRDLAKTLPSLYNKDMAIERENYEDKFYEALEIFKNEVNRTKNGDLKRALYFAFKDYKTSLLEEYTNKIRTKKINGEEPDIDAVIAEVLMFDNKIYNEFDEFRKIIENDLNIKLNNYNGEYNKFKKCPYCGTIWFKIKGCNNVVCGNRTKIKDRILGKYKDFEIIFENKTIIINWDDFGEDDKKKGKTYKDNVFNGLTEEEKNENEYRELNGRVKINPIGCGKPLKWGEMEDCSEEVIKKLKDISPDDYYSGFYDVSRKYGK